MKMKMKMKNNKEQLRKMQSEVRKAWWAKRTPVERATVRANISEKLRQAWAKGKFAKRLNGALQPEVQKLISEKIKAHWEDGSYDGRVNGMKGAHAEKNPGWTGGTRQYRAIYEQFWPLTCCHCGTSRKVEVHHVDEDHANYLLSNWIALCIPCHAWRYHYKRKKKPFVTITKKFPFEYSHVLPWHPGKCGRLHGHSGHFTVEVRGRLDPNGVVEDYYDIGRLTKMVLIDRLDHQFLNDWLPNPTSEEFLSFAWVELQQAGLKGIEALTFSETETTTARLEKRDMLEAFWWALNSEGEYIFVPKNAEEDSEI